MFFFNLFCTSSNNIYEYERAFILQRSMMVFDALILLLNSKDIIKGQRPKKKRIFWGNF